MKVSLNWLKDYLEISRSPEEIADELTALGLEASFENRGKSFTGVVLGKVLECGPHPNADKLSVCEVDTGDDENYTIVCGAPNVKKGIHVPVAKTGATLQNGEFTIKKAKLRGVQSNGMICSGKELAINDDHEGILILDNLDELFSKNGKFLAITHVSNVLGTINPIKEIVDKAHDFGLVTLVDAAQSVPHMPVDVSSLNSDFFVFSGHKMLGPSGIGVLHAKQELLQNMDPFLYGGDMISSVSLRDAQWNDIPWKFEAGTPNIVGAIGLGKAIDYLNHLDMDNVRKHEQNLLSYALKKLNELGDIHVFGPKNPEITGGVLSFSYSDFHPHDIASILDTESIAIRAGHHCAQPLVEKLGVPATTRVSFYVYNDKSDIDKFVHGLEKVRSVLS